MLYTWGNPTECTNGTFRINMDMNYDGTNPGIGAGDYSFYWQTLNVTFNIDTPEITTNTSTNIEETSAKLNGYLQSNGSVDTTCYFVWDNNSGENYNKGNVSIGLIENQKEFSYNLTNLSKGNLYYYNTEANNIAGWNISGGEQKFLTKPDSITDFKVTMINSSKIVLSWEDGIGGDGVYLEYAQGTQPAPWNIGNGTTIDADGYITSPFNHTNLTSSTRYYYKAWAYAEHEGWKSSGNITAPFGSISSIENNKTNSIPLMTNELPLDNDIDVDKIQLIVNVTIEDPDGDNINWTIKGTNLITNSSNSDINGSKSANLSTPLPYNTNIIWYTNVTDGYDWNNRTYNFTTREKYIPIQPNNFSANSINRTQIYLNWTNSNRTDFSYIECNENSDSWNKSEGIFLYNNTGTSYSHSNISPGTTIYYQIWSWNNTDDAWSDSYSCNNDTTYPNSCPTFGIPNIKNSSSEHELALTWHITINDTDEDTLNWTIECNNGNSSIGSSKINGSKQLQITNLSYNTTYTIWLNITDSYNWTRGWFNFKTRSKYQPYPPSNLTSIAKGSDKIEVSWINGNKADNTLVEWNSTELWLRGTGIQIYNGTGLSFIHTKLDKNTKYYYQAWSWNETGNLWSTTNISSNATTDKKKENSGNHGGSPSLPPPTNQEPTANPGGPYTGYAGIVQTFDGSKSNDSDGNITLYKWKFGDDNYGTGKKITHIYKEVGNYTVTLTVTDDNSTNSEKTTYILINNLPPKKPILKGVTSGIKDTFYKYTIISKDSNNDTLRYLIKWGDNSNITLTNIVESDTMINVTHVWKKTGIYVITAYALDKHNASSEVTDLTVLIDIHFCNNSGYLIDKNSDGMYDSFFSNKTGEETLVKHKNGKYLIDNNNDGNWNYTFDPANGFLLYQKNDIKETPSFSIILIFYAILLILSVEKRCPPSMP